MPNIVQAEFFHVGGEHTTSLETLFEECGERVREGFELVLQGIESRSRIKTVVRFFDDNGKLTRLALKAERLRRQDKKVLESFMDSTGLRRWWLDKQSRRLAGQSIKLKKEMNLLAAKYLRQATRNSSEVAIEKSDHSFRLIHKDETHEVTEAAARSKGVWLFIFKPNDLLADTNVSVAYAM